MVLLFRVSGLHSTQPTLDQEEDHLVLWLGGGLVGGWGVGSGEIFDDNKPNRLPCEHLVIVGRTRWERFTRRHDGGISTAIYEELP